MRLKYIKMTFIITTGIMMIGFITFSMSAPSIFGKKPKNENKNKNVQQAKETKEPEEVSDQTISEKVTALVEAYFAAKIAIDMEKMEDYVTDIAYVDEAKLVTEAQWFEAIEDIKCTILSGVEEGTYRVYVYHKVKLYNIDILVPSLNALFITTSSDGRLLIYNNEMNEEQLEYINKLDKSEEVKELQDSVSKEFQEIIDSDKDVRKFYEMLEGSGIEEEESQGSNN